MSQFVRVSGFGQDEIDAAKREGMTQFVEQAMCSVNDYAIPVHGVQLAKNATVAVLTNKTIPHDGILIFTATGANGNPHSDYSLLSLDVNASSGYCQYIWSNGYSWYTSAYEYETKTWIYKVKKNAIINANLQSLEKTLRVSCAWWLIYASEES